MWFSEETVSDKKGALNHSAINMKKEDLSETSAKKDNSHLPLLCVKYEVSLDFNGNLPGNCENLSQKLLTHEISVEFPCIFSHLSNLHSLKMINTCFKHSQWHFRFVYPVNKS